MLRTNNRILWEHRFLSLQHQQLLPKNHNLGKQALGPSMPDKPEQ
jgi:hypothetical protein